MSGKDETLKRFRSGSIESGNSPFSLSVNEGRSRSYSTNETDHVRSSSPAPSRRSDIEGLKQALFRTSSLQTGQSQSSPLSGGSSTPTPERKAYKKQPAGTFVYAIQEGDTLSKIAARFEVTPSLLMKANKLLSRTVFVGQSLFIPTVGYCCSAPSTPRNISPTFASAEQGDSPAIIVNAPTEIMGFDAPAAPVPTTTITGPAVGATTEQHKAGKESQPRFLRLPARRLLEEEDESNNSEGLTVRGTMLVTPNSIMFDPDVNDPHVISGDELQKYGVVVYMEEIKGVALYHDLSPKLFWQQTQQIRAKSPRPETYRSKNGHNSEVSPAKSASGSPARTELAHNTIDVTDGAQDLRHSTHCLPSVPTAELETQLKASLEKLTTTSGNETKHVQNKCERKSLEEIEGGDILHPEPVAFSDQSQLLPTNNSRSEAKQEVVLVKPSPVKLSGATEPAKSIHDKTNLEPLLTDAKTDVGHIKSNNHSSNSLSSAAGSSLSSSPQVSQILLTSDTGVTSPLNDQTDSSPSEKKSSSRRNSWSKKKKPTAIGKLASQVVVNFSWGPTIDQKENSAASVGSVSAFAPIHSIGQIKREKIKLQFKSEFTLEDMSRVLGPDPREYLMKSDCALFESPLYLQIRRGVPKNDNMFQPRAFDHRNVGPPLSEYWFIVPRGLGDKVYHFLMAWQPDVYGDQEETHSRDELFYDVESAEGQQRLAARRKFASAGSRSPDDESKSWEILSKEEVYGAEKDDLYRQEDIDESCIPELLGPTLIIQREQLLAILRSLPLNMTVGFNWRLIYATHSHGYSLQNLYVKTEAIEQDTPVLLVIKDASNCVFGAYLSNNLRIHDTFYGTGLTYLFTFHPKFKKFPWHGDNRCFIHGTRDFIAIGCGENTFGLWLDESLDKGRSQKCPTFQNEVLGLEEDFRIVQLEVWTFEESHYC